MHLRTLNTDNSPCTENSGADAWRRRAPKHGASAHCYKTALMAQVLLAHTASAKHPNSSRCRGKGSGGMGLTWRLSSVTAALAVKTTLTRYPLPFKPSCLHQCNSVASSTTCPAPLLPTHCWYCSLYRSVCPSSSNTHNYNKGRTKPYRLSPTHFVHPT